MGTEYRVKLIIPDLGEYLSGWGKSSTKDLISGLSTSSVSGMSLFLEDGRILWVSLEVLKKSVVLFEERNAQA